MRISRWIAIGALAAAGAAAAWIAVDLRGAYRRITGSSSVVPTPHGDVEYRRGGAGPPVLVLHGSGGGYDQGELIARSVLGDGFHWIAPSRFGYLRSTFPAGATFDHQARAYADLLDHLGIEEVAVLALSHGGPSALLFAVLYPDRVSSLTLLSCGVASSSDPVQAQANRKGDALTVIFKYDLLYWGASHLLRRRLLELMGADGEIVAGLTRDQRELVESVIDSMNPVAPRSAGVAFDNRAAMPNERITAIRAPTLILHARDDRLQLYRNAEYAVATIPGGCLVPFEKGGHLLFAVEQPAIRDRVREFILGVGCASAG